MVEVPEPVRRWACGAGAETRAWLARVPELVEECLARWTLSLERVLPADYSVVAAVVGADGVSAVLKLVFPEPENRNEAEALRRWNGRGAVRLLEADAALGALLLERAEPGRHLWELPEEEGVAVAAGLLPMLWERVADGHPFELLSDLAARWALEVPERFEGVGGPFDASLAREATVAFAELGRTQGEQFLLHRDFHRGNVLSARREPWLAIDPKTCVGEREFDAAWLLGDRSANAVRRLDFLAAELDLDRERLRRWTIARYVLGGLWTYEEGRDGGEAIALAAALM